MAMLFAMARWRVDRPLSALMSADCVTDSITQITLGPALGDAERELVRPIRGR